MNLTPEKLREITDRASEAALNKLNETQSVAVMGIGIAKDKAFFEQDRPAREEFTRSVVEQVEVEGEKDETISILTEKLRIERAYNDDKDVARLKDQNANEFIRLNHYLPVNRNGGIAIVDHAINTILELQAQLAAHSWVPVAERRPTREDADAEGYIEGFNGKTRFWMPWNGDFTQVSHWRAANLPKMPRPSKEESERREFEAAWDKLPDSIGTPKEFAFKIWQAARAGKETP